MKPNAKRVQNKAKTKIMTKSDRRESKRLLTKLLREKRKSDKSKVFRVTSCVSRTVELPSTSCVGEEKNQLLFILALDMIPKYEKSIEPNLTVRLQRLNPALLNQAKAQKENHINETLRNQRSNQKKRIDSTARRGKSVVYTPLALINHCNETEKSTDDVEVIDLLSDDESEDKNNEKIVSTSDYNRNISFMSPETGEIIDLVESDEEDVRQSNSHYKNRNSYNSTSYEDAWSNMYKEALSSKKSTVEITVNSQIDFCTAAASHNRPPIIFQQIENYLTGSECDKSTNLFVPSRLNQKRRSDNSFRPSSSRLPVYNKMTYGNARRKNTAINANSNAGACKICMRLQRKRYERLKNKTSLHTSIRKNTTKRAPEFIILD